jgi:hypothetical protein
VELTSLDLGWFPSLLVTAPWLPLPTLLCKLSFFGSNRNCVRLGRTYFQTSRHGKFLRNTFSGL